jgi:glycosyltransferase involved in cell wall biosynthesis
MLSVIILTKNEEKNLRDAILSVKYLADEIIVADSGSTDNTLKIAQDLYAKILKIKWQGWVHARNYAIAKAKHDMVLFLDADERPNPELQQSIIDEKKNGFPHQVYSFSRRNFINARPIKYGAWNPDIKIRLFHKNAAKWEGGSVHEKVDTGSYKAFLLKGYLLHYGYFDTGDELFVKARKYAALASEDLKEKSFLYLISKIIFSPLSRFLRDFFIKLGFLDGFAGFFIALASSYEVLMKYVLAIQKKRKQKETA